MYKKIEQRPTRSNNYKQHEKMTAKSFRSTTYNVMMIFVNLSFNGILIIYIFNVKTRYILIV